MHEPEDCTYRCPNTGDEVLAFRGERHVVVSTDEYRALRAVNEAAGEVSIPETVDGVDYCRECRTWVLACACPMAKVRRAIRNLAWVTP